MSHRVERLEIIESGFTPEQASVAARTLAKLPRRQPRKLTGLLHDRRCWRGQRILLPGGRPAFVWGCKQGKVVWSLAPNELSCEVLTAGRDWGVLSESEVVLKKSEAATVLGRAKRGIREAPSALKQAAARLNGLTPCRAGRRRGRPRRSAIKKRKQVGGVIL